MRDRLDQMGGGRVCGVILIVLVGMGRSQSSVGGDTPGFQPWTVYKSRES